MNITDSRYKNFNLVKEMMESSEIISKFDFGTVKQIVDLVRHKKKLYLTGEGSSRIFPAKNAISRSRLLSTGLEIYTEGARQSAEYNLDDFVVFGASNSGKTKEVIELFRKLKGNKNINLVALTANNKTPLEELSQACHVLRCGSETAVAATKSVMEQALFYISILSYFSKDESMRNNLLKASEAVKSVLQLQVSPKIIETLVRSKTIYFAGRNDGVSEELTLKTNEITRKKSAYLEGTYAVHGIEEVMDANETVIVVEPFREEVEKFNEVLIKGVGMNVIAISKNETPFPTLKIPEAPHYNEFIQLAAGWNLLVEIGIAAGIDLDKPVRARKVGNII